MVKSRLQLRPLPMIVLAYLAAPVVAACELWLVWYGPWASPTGVAWPPGGQALGWLLIGGIPVGLVAELVFATPLLVGFARGGWGWLNGWSACALGALIGFLPLFLLDASAPADGDVVNGVALTTQGVRTFAGWLSLAQSDAPWALAGLTTALTFRLIAVRTRPVAEGGAAP